MLVSTLRSDFQDYLENDPGPIKKSLGGRSGTLMEAVGWLWSNFDGSRSWSSGYADFITCVGQCLGNGGYLVWASLVTAEVDIGK